MSKPKEEDISNAIRNVFGGSNSNSQIIRLWLESIKQQAFMDVLGQRENNNTLHRDLGSIQVIEKILTRINSDTR